jgi:hypothetical protein
VLAAVAVATVLETEAALDAFRRLDSAEAWLLLTLPIDIVVPINTVGKRGIGRDFKNLKSFSAGVGAGVERMYTCSCYRTKLTVRGPK